jgi:hypothetical protein
MIITRLVSGLGNQLFQFVIGRQLSLMHGVPLKLDTSFFQTQSLRNFSLHNYNIQAGIASPGEIASFLHWQQQAGIVGKIYRKFQRSLPRTKQRYFKEKEWWLYDPDLLNVLSNVYLDGYWQHYKYFTGIAPEIFSELTLQQTIPAAAEMAKEIAGQPASVSIHIRRGDYVTDGLMGVLPIAYYQQAVAHISRQFPGAAYYIFSDDLEWVKDHLKIAAPVTYVELEEDARHDFVELDLMRRCHHNIIANSSFSWWGAFLNRNPQKLVIAPAQWVKQPQVNARIKLQFPSWIKM